MELIGTNSRPIHFNSTLVARGAGRQLFHTANSYLVYWLLVGSGEGELIASRFRGKLAFL
jgi:hypothetical protein